MDSNDTDFTQLRHNTIENIGKDIINIDQKCRESRVSKVIIPSVLVKNNIKVTKFIRHLYYFLRNLCSINDFYFISNNIFQEILFFRMMYILIKMVHVS